MHKFFKASVYWALATLLVQAPALAEKTVTYKNQRGSVLTLKINDSADKTGLVTGTFTSAVGPCAAGKVMPVTGYINGNAVAITVDLEKCEKVIAMTGNLTDNDKELHTLWFVASQAADPRAKDWNANVMGADHYHMEESK